MRVGWKRMPTRSKSLTVHGSKGLEFPVVLVPFGWDPPLPSAVRRAPSMTTAVRDLWTFVGRRVGRGLTPHASS